MKRVVVFIALLHIFALSKAQPFWFSNYGGMGNDEALDIASDNAGNYVVTGYFTQSVTFGTTVLITSSVSDIFIARYSASGTLLWAKKAGGSGADRGYSVRCDAAGNSYITGYFNGTATFGAFTLTAHAGSQDIFVAKPMPMVVQLRHKSPFPIFRNLPHR